MAPKDAALLETSQDPDELLDVADQFAAGLSTADREVVLRALTSDGFLNRLDSEEDYQAPPRQLRLARILKTLMDAPDAGAGVLVRLTQSPVFVALEPRQNLLIRALAAVRPAPEQAVAFWRRHSTPDAVWRHVTVWALGENGSAPALALLEEILSDPAQDPDEKVAWMHDAVLVHRNSPEMLAMAERLLGGGLDPALRPDLVESLFDYRPDDWYLECTPPEPPPRAAMSRDARERLRRIGERALAEVELTEEQQANVRAVLEALPE